jgi:methyltransferase
VIPAAALAVVIAFMLVELMVSTRHEEVLRARGAVEPPDPVYPTMRWAYPAVFVAMAMEGIVFGGAPRTIAAAGIGLFAAAKILKIWAIAALGERWTYKVLVLPGTPLVSAGPYRFVRHPNYVGVIGELVGMALITGARVTGPFGLLFFSWLLVRRVRSEERALGEARHR